MKVTQFQYSLFGINTYIVYDPATRECAVIDPGMSSDEERDALTGYVEREKLTVKHVINTHLHVDHAIGNSFVSRHYGVSPEAHAADLPLGERMRQQAAMFGMDMAVDDAGVTQFLQEGDTIAIGTGCLEVLHVPGHSPGSIALYDRKDGFVIVGDVLFNGSIGRTDLPGGNGRQLIEGIKSKLLVLSDDTVVYPGHGPATTIGAERRSNPFLI